MGIRLSPTQQKTLNQAAKKTGIRKADIIRAAVACFLEANSKPEEIIAATINQRAKEAAA
jgi:predicted DNA-binding protein